MHRKELISIACDPEQGLARMLAFMDAQKDELDFDIEDDRGLSLLDLCLIHKVPPKLASLFYNLAENTLSCKAKPSPLHWSIASSQELQTWLAGIYNQGFAGGTDVFHDGVGSIHIDAYTGETQALTAALEADPKAIMSATAHGYLPNYYAYATGHEYIGRVLMQHSFGLDLSYADHLLISAMMHFGNAKFYYHRDPATSADLFMRAAYEFSAYLTYTPTQLQRSLYQRMLGSCYANQAELHLAKTASSRASSAAQLTHHNNRVLELFTKAKSHIDLIPESYRWPHDNMLGRYYEEQIKASVTALALVKGDDLSFEYVAPYPGTFHSFKNRACRPVSLPNSNTEYYQVDTPPDGGCLLYSCFLNLMLIHNQDQTKLSALFQKTFCLETAPRLQTFQNFLQTYNGKTLGLYNMRLDGHRLAKHLDQSFRTTLIKFMQDHLDEYRHIKVDGAIIETNPHFDQYLQRVKNPGAWMGLEEIRALSDFFGVDIEVYHEVKGHFKSLDAIAPTHPDQESLKLCYMPLGDSNYQIHFGFIIAKQHLPRAEVLNPHELPSALRLTREVLNPHELPSALRLTRS
jgi:hypothetical protein